MRKQKRESFMKGVTFRRIFHNNAYVLRLVWRVSPARILLQLLYSLLDFGCWVFGTVIFMRYLFGAADMNRSFQDVAVFLGCAVVGWLLVSLFSDWVKERYLLINNQKLYRELNELLFDKACNVDLACYEDAEFYNSYTKAANEVFTRCTSVVENLCNMLGSLLASAYVIYTMFTINVWVGLASLLPVITNLTLGKRAGQIEYEKNMDMVPDTRRQAYVNRVFYLQQYAKEIRLTNVYNILAQSYHNAMAGIIRIAKRYWKRIFAINALRSTICFPLLFEGTWLLGAYLAMVPKSITVSDFVILANAAVSTTWMIISLTEAMVATFENTLYIDNLHAFLEYEEAIPEDQPGRPVPAQVETLELRDVSFRYRGAKRDALRHVSATFERGKLVSIVGHNGSGKSTLVKLLMRLYDPTAGTILLNGVDIREYDLAQYRALVGSAFQDFQIFSLSVEDNVAMGNAVWGGDPRAAALDALARSGVAGRIGELPRGVDTTLTREFDEQGANLSGGEAQKVAVARSFAKQSSILLLDEPSSALDPIAEYRLYQNFIELCRGEDGQQKISAFISHRLSSSTVADSILLMQEGEITERGTHAQLMRLNGAYASMFRKQAENYLMEEVRGA